MRAKPSTALLRRLPEVEEEHESWRPVAGFEGLYEVSDLGRVRSLDHEVGLEHRYGGTVTHSRQGLVLIPSADRRGRLRVSLSRQGAIRDCGVAALVLETFVGPKPSGHRVGHRDGDKSYCALENLSWQSRSSVRADERQFIPYRGTE